MVREGVPVRVLQINAVNKILSTGRICMELKNHFISNGDECIVAYSQGPFVSDDYVVGNKLDWKCHALLSRISGKQGCFSFKSTRKLLRFMDEYKPDVVMLHNLHANYINVPMLLKYLGEHNIATVLFLHDCWFFTGKCCYYSHNNCEKWKNGCGDCPSLREDNDSWFFDRTKNSWKQKKQLFDKIDKLGVIGVSNWITEEAKCAPILSNAKVVERIYNGIDFDSFYYDYDGASELRKQYNLEGKKIILCVASIWNDRKGYLELLELLKKYLRELKVHNE